MSMQRNVEMYFLQFLGLFEVVRRSSFHLFNYHPVTINTNIRRMLADGLIKEKESGQNKHYILTPKGKQLLRDWGYADYMEFLPSNIRAGSWERLILISDAAILMDNAICLVRPWDMELELDELEHGEEVPMFFPADQVKRYLSDGPPLPAIRYSRLVGLLATQDAPYRVYHSRDVSMAIRKAGERNVHQLLTAKLYAKLGYEQDRVLIVGDKKMTSAEKILRNTVQPERLNKLRGMCKKEGGDRRTGDLLTASTLGASYFVPLSREALPLLRLHTTPGGLAFLQKNSLGLLVGDKAHRMLGERAALVGERICFYAADLHLGAIAGSLNTIRPHLKRGNPVTVFCLDWQQDLLARFYAENLEGPPVEFYVCANNYVEGAVRWLESSANGPA